MMFNGKPLKDDCDVMGSLNKFDENMVLIIMKLKTALELNDELQCYIYS